MLKYKHGIRHWNPEIKKYWKKLKTYEKILKLKFQYWCMWILWGIKSSDKSLKSLKSLGGSPQIPLKWRFQPIWFHFYWEKHKASSKLDY